MKQLTRLLLITLLVPAVAVHAGDQQPPDPADVEASEGWVCPPCGHEHDDRVFPRAGTCPLCEMELIPSREAARAAAERPKVAILLFDGVQIIDYTGPYEVFGQARFDVFTVSETGEPITTTMDMVVDPTHSFESSPMPDVLLVPGGHVHDVEENAKWLEWVRRAAAEADYVLSVCNGAFILGRAGLLKGKTATTFHRLIDDLERDFPETRVVHDQRYTDNGKILTSAGLSSGIDAAIYLVSKIQDERAARSLALHLEYPWDPEAGFVRGLLADRHLPDLDLDLPQGTDVRQLTSLGSADDWEVRLAVETDRSAVEILEIFTRATERVAGWTLVASPAGSDESVWAVETATDGTWTARMRVTSDAEVDGLVATATLERSMKTAAASR